MTTYEPARRTILRTGYALALLLPATCLAVPTLHFGVNWASEASHGYVNLIQPWQALEADGVFLDLRGVAGSQDSREFNLGIGRRVAAGGRKGWWGTYAFYDRRHSVNNNTVHQLTLGSDWLSESFDARMNVYLPDKDTTRIASGPSGLGGAGVTRDDTFEEAQRGMDVEVGLPLPWLNAWSDG